MAFAWLSEGGGFEKAVGVRERGCGRDHPGLRQGLVLGAVALEDLKGGRR